MKDPRVNKVWQFFSVKTTRIFIFPRAKVERGKDTLGGYYVGLQLCMMNHQGCLSQLGLSLQPLLPFIIIQLAGGVVLLVMRCKPLIQGTISLL